MPHKFFERNWIAIRRLVSRLKLAFPLGVTWPLCRDEYD
jgi:hypothetical protein